MFTLNELREIVRLQLIQEINVVDLANRQLSRVAIIPISNALVAVSTSEIVMHDGVPIPSVLGLAQCNKEFDGNYRLHRLYADTPAMAIVLLAAALENWKSVLTDFSVSPAAQQVIKRYYGQHKDNPKLIEPDVDAYRRGNQPAYLKAAYLGPIGFDLTTAFEHGDKMIRNALAQSRDQELGWDRDDVFAMIKDAAYNGFDRAYSDVSKTRHSYDDLLADESEELLIELMKAFQREGDAKDKALTWITLHQEEIRAMLDVAAGKTIRDWDRIIQPTLDKLNSEA